MTIMGNIPKTDLYEGINHCDEVIFKILFNI